MQQRGRKGAAEVETLGAIALVERPPAPLDLTPEETDVWMGVVDALPADWFPRETWGLMAQYCRHIVAARRIAQLVDAEMAREDLDIKALDQLLGMQARETSSIKATSASMRLSQQSAYNAKTASTAKSARVVKRPWES